MRKISPNGSFTPGINSLPYFATKKVDTEARIMAHTRPDAARQPELPVKQKELTQLGRRQSRKPGQLKFPLLGEGTPVTTFPVIHTHKPIFDVVPVTGTAWEIVGGTFPSFVWKRATLVFVSFMSIPENDALTVEATKDIRALVGGLTDPCDTLKPGH
jgi:hypothetical protein